MHRGNLLGRKGERPLFRLNNPPSLIRERDVVIKFLVQVSRYFPTFALFRAGSKTVVISSSIKL